MSFFFLRILSFLFISFLFIAPVGAMVNGYGPEKFISTHRISSTNIDAQINYGIGVYFAPEKLPVYAKPSFSEPPIDIIEWRSANTNSLVVRSVLDSTVHRASQYFLAFYPKLKLAVLPVLQENGAGWAEVVINPGRHTTAWVPMRYSFNPNDTNKWPKHWARFQPWIDFIRANARISGVRWLPNATNYQKELRMQPQDDAELIELTLIRQMKVHHARGNWLLVEAWDFNRESPIGWMRWRDDDGQLLAFPNFSAKTDMMIPGSF